MRLCAFWVFLTLLIWASATNLANWNKNFLVRSNISSFTFPLPLLYHEMCSSFPNSQYLDTAILDEWVWGCVPRVIRSWKCGSVLHQLSQGVQCQWWNARYTCWRSFRKNVNTASLPAFPRTVWFQVMLLSQISKHLIYLKNKQANNSNWNL